MVFCPESGEEGRRNMVSCRAFVLKGSGWYETDFKNPGKAKPKDTTAMDGQHASKNSSDTKSGDGASGDTKSDDGASGDTKSSDSKSSESKSVSSKSTSDSTATGSKSCGSKNASPTN